jgi:hypothetical protein
MDWQAWGVSWGQSWGESWGPLHQVEETPGQYYGNGRRKAGPSPDPWRDTTEADIEALVRDKWDAIEKAQARPVKDSLTPGATTKAIQPSESGHSADVTETDFGNILAPSIVAEHWPDADIEDAAILRSRAQAQEDEALLLILAEML